MKYFVFLLPLLLFACGDSSADSAKKGDSTSSFANCKYGSPKPIFSKGIPLVTSHQFELGSDQAVETVYFSADTKLELIQSGCEKPKQEFKFTIPGNTKEYAVEEWIDLALNQLDFLGNLHKPLEPLLFWSGALKQKKEVIKLGQPVNLEQGHYVKIDKISGEEHGVLMIEMSQY